MRELEKTEMPKIFGGQSLLPDASGTQGLLADGAETPSTRGGISRRTSSGPGLTLLDVWEYRLNPVLF